MKKDYPFFSHSELCCPCCGKQEMPDRFIHHVIFLRSMLNEPMIISSGYRCPKHNNEVSTTGFDGPHTIGAVDVLVAYEKAYHLAKLAFQLGFTGIGIHQTGDLSKRIIHLDRIETPNRPRIWSY